MPTLFDTSINKYRDRSITQKLIFWVLILGASVMLVGAAIRVFIFHYESRIDLEKQADLIAFFLEKPLEKAILNNDKNYITTVIKDLAKYPSVVNVSLSYEKNNSFITINESSRSFRDKEISTLDFRYNLDLSDGSAYLALILKHQAVNKNTTTKLAYNMLIECLIILSIVLGVLFFVKRLIIKHLNKISTFALNMSLETLSDNLVLDRKKLKNDGNDELDHVVTALEKMRQTLIEDIEERHSIEVALLAETKEKMETKRLAEEAKASNQAKSQFIATMSHEIRTPMNGVIGTVELLRDTPMNEQQQKYLEIIFSSAKSLMNFMNDTLDYSELEAGRIVLDKTEFDLQELFQDCIQLFSATAQKHNFELITNITPDTPTFLIGDATRVKQVIVNLLGNACKFTSEGYVLLQANLVNSEHNEHTLHFSILDSGIGIDDAIDSNLFDAFRQVDGSTTRQFGGTGLGLTICKHVVELMGGHIGFRSQHDRGSHFWFTCVFPSSHKTDSEIQRIQNYREPLNDKHILCITESSCIEKPLKTQCDYFNMHLHSGDSGLSALQLIHSADQQFDFIILNEWIGRTPGIELAVAIKKMDNYKDIPILLLSAENTLNRDKIDHSIVTAIIPTPVNINRLIETIATTVENKAPSLSAEITKAEPQTEKLKVLVAEDNAVNRMVIDGLLKRFDAQAYFCENGIETLSIYGEKDATFDVVFMDCEMPEMDGFEATRKIRDFETQLGKKRIPIIALTAHVESDHRQRVFDVGMDYYLSKPITYKKLHEALVSMHLL